MNLVVDTSVIIAVIANEPEKPALIEHTVGANLLAPSSVHWEIGNAFSSMLKRKRITLTQVQRAIEIYSQVSVRFVEVDLIEALKLSNQLGIYAYDAYLISCALNLRCALLTLDEGLRQAANQAGIKVVEVKP